MDIFGIDWDSTPFLDKKASFQRGVNQAVRRTTVELVDTLGASAVPRRSIPTYKARVEASEVLKDAPLEICADVGKSFVARRVGFGGQVRDEMLSGAFGNNDNGVAALFEPLS